MRNGVFNFQALFFAARTQFMTDWRAEARVGLSLSGARNVAYYLPRASPESRPESRGDNG